MLTAERTWKDRLRSVFTGREGDSPGLRPAVVNTGWLVADRVFRLAMGLLVTVWIARYLGPSGFGIYNYALSFTAIVGVVASLGLDTIVVRELVNAPLESAAILGTSGVLRVVGGFAVVLISIAVSFIPASVNDQTRILIVVLALAYPFQASDAIEYWFQSQVRMRYAVVARNTAFIGVSVLKIAALLLHGSLLVLCVLTTIESAMAAAGLWLAYRSQGGRISAWRSGPRRAVALLRDSWPLTISSLAILIYMRIDQVMIGEMLGAQAVGIYASAVRVVEIWYFIPTAIATSVFPAILRSRSVDRQLYIRRMQRFYDGMTLMSLALCAVLVLFAPLIIRLLFGALYDDAIPVLRIYAWSAIATFLGVASSQYLIAENFTRISMYRTFIGMVLNVGLNFIFIRLYGLTGSAVATVVSYTAATFSMALFRGGRRQAWMMIRSLTIYRILVPHTEESHAG